MRRLVSLLVVVLAALSAFNVKAEYNQSDSLNRTALTDTLAPLSGNWFQQLVQTNFHIHDPRIRYPKFPAFCLKVYDWGNDMFNSYDPNYVTSTGKNWKFYVTSYNWNQSYRYVFNLFDEHNVTIRSRINTDVGLTLSFMAVSLSIKRNLNETIDGKKTHRNTLDFSFTCSRFSAEVLSQQTKGNAYIEQYGAYNDGKRIKYSFEGVSQSQTAVTAYYFFNHRKYSQSAAYAYSKYQLRSAGSWIAGARLGHQHIVMDFSDLPDDMKEANPKFPLINTFNFMEYSVLGGYAYNWVLGRHWLINGTALPCVGYRRSELHSSKRTKREMLSTTLMARMSVTYNNRSLFVGMIGKFTGGLVLNNDYSFFNSTQSGTVIIGVRF